MLSSEHATLICGWFGGQADGIFNWLGVEEFEVFPLRAEQHRVTERYWRRRGGSMIYTCLVEMLVHTRSRYSITYENSKLSARKRVLSEYT